MRKTFLFLTLIAALTFTLASDVSAEIPDKTPKTPITSLSPAEKKELEQLGAVPYLLQSVGEIKGELRTFKEQVNKRFDDLKHEIDKRFEQVDKRFERIEEKLDRMEESIRHIEEYMITLLLSVIGIFLGVLIWDRWTFVSRAKRSV